MPQLVALFHSFVGVAATVTCIGNYMVEHSHFAHDPSGTAAIKCALFLGAYIGGVTATGSLMAYGKLQGSFGGVMMVEREKYEERVMIVLYRTNSDCNILTNEY